MAKLSLEDRNLTTALVMGVLRWQIALDAQIANLLTRPRQQLAEQVAIALRLGAFQLQHMDRIPAHAAINESVELCRAAGQDHTAGLVNAVLRKLAAAAKLGAMSGADDAKRKITIFDPPAALAHRLGHPAWLVERWVRNFGRDAAQAICEYDQREPGVGSLFAGPTTNDISLPMQRVQIDDGSRLVAELAVAAMAHRNDRATHVWDCCAAPGGKMLVMAERLSGANILATDISPKRLARMKDRVATFPFADRIDCAVMDAGRPSFLELSAARGGNAAFDLILCDAPCSGTGTLARNPEIRHRLRPEDLARQAARQRNLLQSALARLAPGGRLLYSTCSLEPEENEHVVDRVLEHLPGIGRVSLQPVVAEIASSSGFHALMASRFTATAIRDDCLRTLPGIHPCDGFFAALLERR